MRQFLPPLHLLPEGQDAHRPRDRREGRAQARAPFRGLQQQRGFRGGQGLSRHHPHWRCLHPWCCEYLKTYFFRVIFFPHLHFFFLIYIFFSSFKFFFLIQIFFSHLKCFFLVFFFTTFFHIYDTIFFASSFNLLFLLLCYYNRIAECLYRVNCCSIDI